MFPFKNDNKCPACGNPPWRHDSSCPVLRRILSQMNIKRLVTSNEIFGASPPAIMIGEAEYPKINAGILLPPETGNTSLFDAPKTWYQNRMSLEDIFQLRISLVNARKKFPVTSAVNPDRNLELIQEIAASSTSLDTEVVLDKIPRMAIYFDPHAAPYGPTGSLEKARLTENPKIERKVDYIISDTDYKAQPAVLDLYKHGFDVYSISKILSVGLLGMKIQRKLVPTKWSITATDSIVTNQLLKEIKQFQIISEYRVYEINYLGNYFEVILLPTQWMYEIIEMAISGGPWTTSLQKPIMTSDYEFYWGRKYYAENVAGGYYAARVAVLEYLRQIKRQSGVLIIREIRPEYYASVGVWKIRECLRDAMQKKPLIFNTLEEAIQRVDAMMITKSGFWKPSSKIIDSMKHQKKLREFFKCES